MMRILGGKVEIEGVEISRPKRPLVGRIPLSRAELFDGIKETLRTMAEEAPSHLWFESFAKHGVLSYVANSPRVVNIASDVSCSGTGVGTTNTMVYYMENAGYYSPEEFYRARGHWPRIYLAGSPQEVVMVMQGPDAQGLGRARGPFGWDDTRNLVAASLASFTHNWQAVLIAFKERGHIPTSEPWVLPNLVFDPEIARREERWPSYIVEPPQFVPPASYTYTAIRPSLITQFRVGLKSPTPAKVGFDFWGSSKVSVAKVESVDVPEGDSVQTILVRGAPRTGFLNVEPMDCPEGITVASVDMMPMAI